MSLKDPRKVLEDLFITELDPDLIDVRGTYLDGLQSEGFSYLETWFAALPRKAGRDLLELSELVVGEGTVQGAALRTCDLMAADVLVHFADSDAATPDLRRLFDQGDAEERRMIFRSLPFLPANLIELQRDLIGEAHRSNDELLFESGVMDSDLCARILSDEDWNRIVLKAAFLGLPKERLMGWSSRGNEDLSHMLFDFTTERVAAGRPIWADTTAFCRLAPGSLTRRLETESDTTILEQLRSLIAELGEG